MAKSAGCSLDSTHVYAIKSSLMTTAGDFSISLPSGFDFVCQCDKCEISKRKEKSEIKYEYQLWYGLESLRVTYKKAITTGPVEDSKYDYLRLSLRSVEQGKIRELIPRSIPFV
jgi:hypothetical protein